MSDVAKPDAQNAITHRNVDFLMRWPSFIQSPHSIIQPEGPKKKKKGQRGITITTTIIIIIITTEEEEEEEEEEDEGSLTEGSTAEVVVAEVIAMVEEPG